MHDDTQPTRIYEMYRGLTDGQFPVRWVGDLGYGYGYPLFNFYAPLPYYFGALGIFGGLDAIMAAKLMFAAGIVFAGICMFLLARRLWGDSGGYLSAVLYLYFPYHALEIYVRGAVGEYWAYAFLPLVFLGLIIAIKKFRQGVLVGGLGLAVVILSHNILGMLTAGILISWGIWETARGIFTDIGKTKALIIMSVLFLGISLSAFFWLPALVEMKFTRAYTLVEGTNNFRDHFVYPDQLWDSPWGFAGSGPGREDGISFKIGKLHLILAVFGIVALYFLNNSQKDKNSAKLRIGFVLVGGIIVSILMMLSLSRTVWELVPVFAYVQYPWRFLVLVGFCISLLSGAAVLSVKRNGWQMGGAVFISLLAIFVNVKYFQPQTVSDKTVSSFTNPEKIRWDISNISDEYLPLDFPVPQKFDEVAQNKFTLLGDIIVESSEVKNHFIKLNVSARDKAEIDFSVANFPGWQIVLDTQKVRPRIMGRYLVVPLTEGKHIVSLYFTDTWIRVVGNAISLFGVLVSLAIAQKIICSRNEKN